MENFRAEFAVRTRKFAVRVIRLVEILPRTTSGFVLGKQIVSSATSVGANFRSACRGRSSAEFISKLGIAKVEADETVYWLELLIESGMVKDSLHGSHEGGERDRCYPRHVDQISQEVSSKFNSELRIPN